MSIAMTVGATKIQILHESCTADLPVKDSSENESGQSEEIASGQEICSA